MFKAIFYILTLFMFFLISGCDNDTEENLILEIDVEGPGEVSGSGTFPEGEEVTVEAIPDEKSEFIGWYKDEEKVSSDFNHQLEMEQDTRLTAVFNDKEKNNEITEEYFTLEIDVQGPGEISGTDSGTYLAGKEVTVEAIPDEGSKLVSWRRNGSHTTSDQKYKFELERDITLKAIFVSKDIYKENDIEENKDAVQFKCDYFKKVIQRKLNKRVITRDDMKDLVAIKKVDEIEIEKEEDILRYKSDVYPISSFEGLQYANNLEILGKIYAPVDDLSPLSELDNLEKIDLYSRKIPIKNLSPLSNLNNIEILSLPNTKVKDFSPLSKLDGLKELRISSYRIINDLSPLSNLKQLEVLDLSNSPDLDTIASKHDISSLYGLKENLKVLKLDGNIIKDEDKLLDFTNLEVLSLSRCDINEFSFLAELRNLESLEIIDLRGNELNRKAMKYIEELKEEGIEVRYHERLAP